MFSLKHPFSTRNNCLQIDFRFNFEAWWFPGMSSVYRGCAKNRNHHQTRESELTPWSMMRVALHFEDVKSKFVEFAWKEGVVIVFSANLSPRRLLALWVWAVTLFVFVGYRFSDLTVSSHHDESNSYTCQIITSCCCHHFRSSGIVDLHLWVTLHYGNFKFEKV